MYTSFASRGSADFALASIMSVSRFWSSEPQFTPMRTGLSWSIAACTIVVKFVSRCFVPTLPGLIRYLSSVAAHCGYLVSSRCPL